MRIHLSVALACLAIHGGLARADEPPAAPCDYASAGVFPLPPAQPLQPTFWRRYGADIGSSRFDISDSRGRDNVDLGLSGLLPHRGRDHAGVPRDGFVDDGRFRQPDLGNRPLHRVPWHSRVVADTGQPAP